MRASDRAEPTGGVRALRHGELECTLTSASIRPSTIVDAARLVPAEIQVTVLIASNCSFVKVLLAMTFILNESLP